MISHLGVANHYISPVGKLPLLVDVDCRIERLSELYGEFYSDAWCILLAILTFDLVQILSFRTTLCQPMVKLIKQNKRTNLVGPRILIFISWKVVHKEIINIIINVIIKHRNKKLRLTWGTPSSNAASTKLSRSCRREPADITWQFTRSDTKRTKYRASSHLELFKQSFNERINNSTHCKWK